MSLSSPAPLSWSLLAVGTVAFLTLGVMQALYGPAFALFQSRYGVSKGAVGLIASAHFLGAAAAPPLMGLLLRRLSIRAGTAWSLLGVTLGMVGVAAAPSWALAVGAAVLGGVGMGGVSTCLNATYASVGTRAVNLVNAMFGVGSMLAPLLVVTLGARGLAWPFLSVVVLCGLTLVVARVWGVPAVPLRAAAAAPARPGLQAGLFAALVGCAVGLEAGYGAWTVGYLTEVGAARPTLVLSLFWGALTVGRVLTGLWGARLAAHHLVLGCAAVLALCAVAAMTPALAAAACILAGLALGPLFGTALAWLSQVLSARLVPLLLVSGSVGGVLAPVVLGALLARFGPAAIPGGLLALALLLGVVTYFTQRGAAPGLKTP